MARRITNLVTILFVFNFSLDKTYSQEFMHGYWGVSIHQHRNQLSSDTILIDKLSKLKNVLELPYSYGFLFNKDGTFEEIYRKTCGSGRDRIPQKGYWFYEKGYLILKVLNDEWLRVRIIEHKSNQLVTTDWIY